MSLVGHSVTLSCFKVFHVRVYLFSVYFLVSCYFLISPIYIIFLERYTFIQKMELNLSVNKFSSLSIMYTEDIELLRHENTGSASH